MEIATFIVSLIALFVSVYTYFIHDKKIKKQEFVLNEYQLEKIKVEREQRLQAKVESSISLYGGTRTLTTTNTGESPAKNVRIEFISDTDGIIYRKIKPHPLLRRNEIITNFIHLSENHENTLKIKYLWNDDSGENIEDIQILSL